MTPEGALRFRDNASEIDGDAIGTLAQSLKGKVLTLEDGHGAT